MFQVAHIPGLAGITVAENLGSLAFATLMDPQGIENYLPVLEDYGTLKPKEDLIDVARVADGIERQLSQRRGLKNESVVAPLTDALVKLSTTQVASNQIAVEQLRSLSSGLSRIPRSVYQRAAIELIRNHPNWVTAETLRSPAARPIMEFRDKMAQKELRDAKLDPKISLIAGASIFAFGVAVLVIGGPTEWRLVGSMGGIVMGLILFTRGAFFSFEDVVRAREVIDRWNRTLPGPPRVVVG